eukprot:2983934-Prorocentrum_lima.AAC.1
MLSVQIISRPTVVYLHSNVHGVIEILQEEKAKEAWYKQNMAKRMRGWFEGEAPCQEEPTED